MPRHSRNRNGNPPKTQIIRYRIDPRTASLLDEEAQRLDMAPAPYARLLMEHALYRSHDRQVIDRLNRLEALIHKYRTESLNGLTEVLVQLGRFNPDEVRTRLKSIFSP